MKKKLTTIALLTLACFATQAQTVYRCGNDYSQTPCTGGKAIDTSDTRSAAQVNASVAKTRHEEKVGIRMEKERLAEEKRIGGPTSIVTGVKPPERAASAGKSAKGKKKGKEKEEYFTVKLPKKPPEKKAAAKKR